MARTDRRGDARAQLWRALAPILVTGAALSPAAAQISCILQRVKGKRLQGGKGGKWQEAIKASASERQSDKMAMRSKVRNDRQK